MTTTSLHLIKSFSQFIKAMVKEVDNEIWNTNAITIGVSDAEKN